MGEIMGLVTIWKRQFFQNDPVVICEPPEILESLPFEVVLKKRPRHRQNAANGQADLQGYLSRKRICPLGEPGGALSARW
jgi:hypothetical protein